MSTVKQGIETVKTLVPSLNDGAISMGISMLSEYLQGVTSMISAILSPEIDMYCRGMVFGL